MDFRNEVLHLRDELVFLRRDFHQNPELGYEEFLTSQKIIKYLTEIGIKVKKVAKTGVVGLLEGGMPGGTVLLRADMDALAIQEMNDVSYKSLKEGKMHACGHDGHMAMLLIAAKILSRHRDRLKGQVKFVFQPNEETAGALDMIKEGVLNDPQVDAAFGIHLWTPLPTGAIGIVAGPIMAANEEFELKIFGKGGHTSAPENAVDPIIAASIVVQTIQTIQTREVSALAPTVIMFGKIRGGTGRNIIAEQVELGGTIRFLYENEDQEKEVLKERFERVIAGICQATRT
ncbi:MAG TPA: amidohydrolase, partial [Clostridia bacterium]|nr:amidohydrolase [Clostridia bacterium]